jgi:hypothetical protein
MSALPTQANTGLTTWVDQGSSTVDESAAGLGLYSPSGAALHLRGLIKIVPTTPYVITALIVKTCQQTINYPGVYFGWYDNSTGKLHIIEMNSNTGGNGVAVERLSSLTNYSSGDATYLLDSPYAWLRLSDDGTTVTFSCSYDGFHFLPMYSVAKASGYLGSTGYNRLMFAISALNAPVYGTLESYTET